MSGLGVGLAARRLALVLALHLVALLTSLVKLS